MSEANRIRAPKVADMLAVSVRKVQQMAKQGRLPGAARIDNLWTFDPDQLELLAWKMNPLGQRRGAAERAAAIAESPEEVIARAVPWPVTGCGIYFLLVTGRVVYVGQARNIAARISHHAANRKFDAWSWVECAPTQLNTLERHYIDALLPDWNQDHATQRIRKSTAA